MKKLLSVAIVLACACLVYAGKYWDEVPYTEWSAKQADKVRSDSPWASVQNVTVALDKRGSTIDSTTTSVGTGGPAFGGPGSPSRSGGESRVGDFARSNQYYVRFQSAKPIRMAIARLSMLNGNVDAAAAEQFVETPLAGGDIVVMLAVAPGQDRTELDTGTTELLKNETYLICKKSKRRVQLKQYLTPAEAGGIEAVFVFPRQENGKDLISVDEKEVRFVTEFSSGTKINRKFKLQDMMFQGRLEI